MKGSPGMEKRVRGELAYRGKIINVRVDQVRLASGRQTVREVVEHPGAVAIVVVQNNGDILLVRQFRYAVGRELLEVPAGTREPGESAEACALREVEEEVGMRAGNIELLSRFYISPGWCNEEMVIYRAWDLQASHVDPDDDEVIDIVSVAPQDVPRLIANREVADAKSITALLLHLQNR
jgi:8-oxo-dGTP pyrophosphatase MutT (NUDIX family)